MKTLPSIVSFLQKSLYLEARLLNKKVADIKLLSNGERYSEQLTRHWLRTSTIPTLFVDDIEKSDSHTTNRTDFIYSPQFRSIFKRFHQKILPSYPVGIKAKQYCASKSSGHIDPTHNLFQCLPTNAGITHLVSYCFCHPNNALEMFYNIQRESKIWWMRCSANPSRYCLDPHNISEVQKTFPSNSQSITIKSRFPFGTTDVEHVTLVPLCEAKLENIEDFQQFDKSTGELIAPAVIRSVIDVEIATCAMLFDGYSHNRENTLLLNRKLAPYQCAVTCLHRDKSLADLRDLCSHLSFVINKAGVRLFKHNIFASSKPDLSTELQNADSIGIPYTLLLEETTLQTGLLKLRNRDTTLEETIHISDIPHYLLSTIGH